MFDRIAHRYDLLNRMLSFGRDVAWRKRMARHLKDTPGQRILDVATGTADQLLFIESRTDRIASGVGIDMAVNMLEIGRRKIAKRNLSDKYALQKGDAAAIPFDAAAFDAVTVSFGIRNVDDVRQGLREMRRILKPGGRALILEFSLPGNALMRTLYLFYFRHILPPIGSVISGDGHAYRYLNRTVESFPYGEAFCDWMREAGFENVHAHPLTFGIATIYQADRPASGS